MKLTILPATNEEIQSGYTIIMFAEHGDADKSEPVEFFVYEEKDAIEILTIAKQMEDFFHECEGGRPYNEKDIPGWDKWFEDKWPRDVVYTDCQTHLDSFCSIEVTYTDENDIVHEVKIED